MPYLSTVSTRRRLNGPTVRAIREARGLRGDAVAAAAAISAGYLSNIEAGRRSPETDKAARIAAALNVPVEVLTGQKPAIAIIREALGIPFNTFARDLGISPQRLARIERGHDEPSRELLHVMARLLGVHPIALQGFDGATITEVAS